jgi:hypothetical protein
MLGAVYSPLSILKVKPRSGLGLRLVALRARGRGAIALPACLPDGPFSAYGLLLLDWEILLAP